MFRECYQPLALVMLYSWCLMTSTNSMLFLLYNGKLTLEHTFSLPTFVNMVMSRFYEAFVPYKELMQTFDADYIDQNNHRKHAKRLNNRVSMQTHRHNSIRNDSNVTNKAAMFYLSRYITVKCSRPIRYYHDISIQIMYGCLVLRILS